MLASLQNDLADEKMLAYYEQHESVRADNLTYGIHVGPLAVLLSVIRGRRPAAALARCRRTLGQIHEIHMVALGDFDPGEPPGRLIPEGLAE